MGLEAALPEVAPSGARGLALASGAEGMVPASGAGRFVPPLGGAAPAAGVGEVAVAVHAGDVAVLVVNIQMGMGGVCRVRGCATGRLVLHLHAPQQMAPPVLMGRGAFTSR